LPKFKDVTLHLEHTLFVTFSHA